MSFMTDKEELLNKLQKFMDEQNGFEPVTLNEAFPYLRSNPFVASMSPETHGNTQLKIMGYKIYKKKEN